MKLVVITVVSSFLEEIKLTLKQSEMDAFSYTRVTGYKASDITLMDENWSIHLSGKINLCSSMYS
ncbi:MAG: hypothetical protein AAGC88_04255 [Bacteroidota bacterium]